MTISSSSTQHPHAWQRTVTNSLHIAVAPRVMNHLHHYLSHCHNRASLLMSFSRTTVGSTQYTSSECCLGSSYLPRSADFTRPSISDLLNSFPWPCSKKIVFQYQQNPFNRESQCFTPYRVIFCQMFKHDAKKKRSRKLENIF